MTHQHVAYEDRFGTALPLNIYPLPIPPRTSFRAPRGKWWPALLDFAEDYVQLSCDGPAHFRIPSRFQVRRISGVVDSVYADIIVGMESYARWTLVPPEEDTPRAFPKGRQVLIDHARADVLHAVQLARAGDWSQHVVDEYLEAYDRCRRTCDAARLGYWPPGGTEPSFTRNHVLQVLSPSLGFVGLVDFGYIRKVLLDVAQESAE